MDWKKKSRSRNPKRNENTLAQRFIAGIRKIYGDKANWLPVLIYFAEIGMRKEGEGK